MVDYTTNIKTAAIKYRELGWTSIPIRYQGKEPLERWTVWREKLLSLDQIETWWGNDAVTNIALLCGGPIIIDIDPAENCTIKEVLEAAKLSYLLDIKTPCVSTGGGGLHIYLKNNGTLSKNLYNGKAGKVHLLSEGKYAVAPPSMHKSGNYYTWLVSPWVTQLSDVPPQLCNKEELPIVVTQATPTPSAKETAFLIQQVLDAIPSDKLKNLLTAPWTNGKHLELDRSGAAYELARLIIEEFYITEKRDLAVLIYGSTIHKSKFAHRADGWDDALRVAERALMNGAKSMPSIIELPEPAVPQDPIPVLPQEDQEILPSYPEKIFDNCGLLSDITRFFVDYTESPVSFLFFTAATILGHICSGTVTLDSSISPNTRLYTILVAPPGVSRKSFAMQQIITLFENSGMDGTVQSGVGSAEGLGLVLSRTSTDISRCLLFLDEFRVLLQKAKIENSVLADMVNQLYDKKYYQTATKKDAITINNAHLSILSATATDAFTNSWSTSIASTGLTSRLWLVTGSTTKIFAIPPPYDTKAMNSLSSKITTFIDELRIRSKTIIKIGEVSKGFNTTPTIKLKFSPDAEKLWVQWYTNIYQVWRKADNQASRLDTHGLKLAMLLEIARGNWQTIESDTIEKVIMLLQHQQKTRHILMPVAAATIGAALEHKIITVLADAPGKTMSRRNLMRVANASYHGAETFNRSIDALAKSGLIQLTLTPSKAVIVTLL